MKEQTLVFNLSEPLEYAKAGGLETTYSLEIAPPAPKYHELVMPLAQKVTRAMLESRKLLVDDKPIEQQEADSSPEDGPQIPVDGIRIMLLASSTPFDEFVKPFLKILQKTCTMDGEVKITQSLFDRLSIKDKNELLFEYVANFTIPLMSFQTLGVNK